jgi:hypothetical protein
MAAITAGSSALVPLVWPLVAYGLIAGGIIGAITGALLGWDDSMQLTMDGYKGLIDGTTGIF